MTDWATRETDELREAIRAARPSSDWRSHDLIAFDIVQGSLLRWTSDLHRSLKKTHLALGAARSFEDGTSEEAADRIEEALTHVVSARDKIVAIAVQILGVPSLWLYKKGVRFEPNETALKAKLSEIGAAEPQAGRLKSSLDSLGGHPAIVLRNQILHALSPVGDIGENCWFRKAILDERGGIESWERGPLYFEGMGELENLFPATIWRWAIEQAEEAEPLLLQATKALARLTASLATIAELQAVYRWPDGRVVLERP
jgi:hypothetical protein